MIPQLVNKSKPQKPNLRLLPHQNKDISVFEQQLSLINSSSLTRSYPQIKLNPYQSHHYNSKCSSSTDSSNYSESTLVGSPFHAQGYIGTGISNSGFLYKSISATKPLHYEKPANKSRNSSVHLRIPLLFFFRCYKYVINNLITTMNYFIESYKSNSDFVLQLLSILYISGFTVFGAELLEVKYSSIFFVGIIVAAFAGFKITTSKHASILLRGSIIELLKDKYDLDYEVKSIISHIVVGFQTFLLCSLLRITSIFKNRFMDTTSKVDYLSLIILAFYVIFISLNMLQFSIPGAIYYSTQGRKGEDSPVILSTALTSVYNYLNPSTTL